MKNGAKVVLADLSTSRGNDVAKELGDNVLFVPVDVTSENDVTNAIAETKNKFGRLDINVNCAGTGVAFKTYNFNKNLPHKLEDFTRVIMVNSFFYQKKLHFLILKFFFFFCR